MSRVHPRLAAIVALLLIAAGCDENPTGGDVTGPAAVEDLRALECSPWSVTLGWTAPGDDGSTGRASRYEILFSTAPIDAGNWTRVPRLAAPPVPSNAGSPEIFRGGGLLATTPYWFAIRAVDERLNWAPLSMAAQATTLAFGYLVDFSRYFVVPQSLAWVPAGEVLVGDRGAVRRFTPDGQYVGRWGSPGNGCGELSEARCLAVRGQSVYVADTDNHRISVFGLTGEFGLCFGGFGTTPGHLWLPRGVATDGAGSVYVVDYNNRVSKFNPGGFLIDAWGKWGNMPGSFDDPRGIAIGPDGDIFTIEMGNARVQRFHPDGRFVRCWGRRGTRDGEFLEPAAIAMDAGEIQVLDRQRGDVQRFTLDGAFLSKWGGIGLGQGQFQYPNGICTDGRGSFYVSQATSARVQKLGTFAAAPITQALASPAAD